MLLGPYSFYYMICCFKCLNPFFKGGDYSDRCPKYCIRGFTLKDMAEICIAWKVDQDLVSKNVP